jgi:N-methylhydantoinase B
MSAEGTMSELDPFTFEVLRHRLWTVNVEGALALQRVSGSPLATEAFDMNTAIMTADGEVAFVGPYLLTGPMGQGMIARHVLANYRDNPGIEPGDMFLCNDPYVGAAHQNCVTLVGPVHVGGEIIAWCGATLHLVDVGGAQSGQVGVGARSIFEEPPAIPPLKIVSRGRLLRDVEASYLRLSRTPELNALDLRGKIAAVNTIAERVRELADRYGTEAVKETLRATIERAGAHLRRRLAELPDGTYQHTAYLDHQEAEGGPQLYAVALTMEKEGDGLRLDFRGSSPQAGAVINCTESALRSGVLVAVLTCLVYDHPWCPAAVERAVRVESTPGTVVDATWPAGCSMSTMAAGFAVTTAAAMAIGQLLAASDAHREHAMAAWAGAVGSVDVFGADRAGRRFGTVLLDSMICGAGARAWADGIDGGGFLRSMAAQVANVEHYESRFPLLYLYRRLEADTGGPGRMRGGAGSAYAVVPHGVDRIDTVVPHFSGTLQPESVGLAGGFPGATNQPLVFRDSRVHQRFADGVVPTAPEEIGAPAEPLPGVAQITLHAGDVFAVVATGGGGWGDPLDRDPMAVAADVRAGLVTEQAARELYGVVLGMRGAADGAATVTIDETSTVAVDETATVAERARIRERRSRRAEWHVQAGERPLGSPGSLGSLGPLGPRTAGPISDALEIVETGGARGVRCRACGRTTPCGGDHRAALPSTSGPVSAAGPHVAPHGPTGRFELRAWYCPGCWRVVEVERAMVVDGGAG